MNLKRTFLLVMGITMAICLQAQDTAQLSQRLPSRYLEQVASRAGQLEQKLDKKTAKALQKWQKQEDRIQRKLVKKDSLKAITIFSNTKQQYKQLEEKLQSKTSLKQYIPALDSMSSSMKFLQQNPRLLSNAKGAQQKLSDAVSKVNGLEEQFQKAEEVKTFLKERKQFLKEQLQNLGFARELKKLNKQAYYYQAQITEYREILKDQKKVEKKAIELLSKTRVFKDFMQKNSFLSRLFPMPDAGSNNLAQQSSGFAGLQTRVQVSSFIQQAGMMSGPNAISQMQKNIRDAQSQLTELRNKIARLGSSGGDDLDIPDFKINSWKTKSFFKRLEYGTNIQSQSAKLFFPATSDLGLSIGYRLNDKSIVGIGASYKLGLGNGWNNIKLTNQGLGLRSYVDWKIRGSFWISGAYEQNYRTQFNRIEELKDLSSWQQSGLVGLSKIISLKTKFFKKTKLQLLWDFLSYQQVPKTQPLLFRIGYNF